MKKIIVVLLFTFLFPLQVKALSVSNNNLTMEKGSEEYIDLYVTTDKQISSLSFGLSFSTYDITGVLVLENGLSETTSGITHNITFNEPITGDYKLGRIKINTVSEPSVLQGTINLSSAKAIDTDNNEVSLSYQDIIVKINETIVEMPKKPKLNGIESDIVNIDFKEDRYEYEFNIKEDIKKLDLNPIVDDDFKVSMSSQKVSELKDNTITINVSNNNESVEYKVKVNVLKEDEEPKEEKEEVKEETVKNDEVVEEYHYKGKWIVIIIGLLGMLFLGALINNKSKK